MPPAERLPEQLLAADWVIPVDPAAPRLLADTTVVVREGRIAALLPHREAEASHPDAVVIRLPGQALIPGLVNAHTHAAMTLLRGLADDLPLLEWLETRIWPAEGRYVSERFVADGTLLAAVEMALGGTTTFNDMYFYPSEAIAAAVAVGVRIQSGITYLATPTPYAGSEREYIERGLQAVGQWQGTAGVSFAWAPHSTYATSARSWARLTDLRSDRPFPLHVHVHETAGEVQRDRDAHGRSPLQRIAAWGHLRAPFAGAHGVHLADDDVALLADSAACIVHCPSSNLKLASGLAPVTRLLAAGVDVGLGTDGAASNNRLDMWQEMRTAALLAKVQSGSADAVTAHQALTMATLGGARAMGLDHDLGTIEPGKAADLAAVDLTGIATQPVYDPISHLVYVVGRENVTNTWVGGRRIVQDRTCVSVSAAEVAALGRQWHDRIAAEFRD